MKKLVVLTGAGISAESGIATFRDAGGLWEGYKVEDVATPEAWHKDPALVLDFYNQRRRKAHEVKPNRGHEVLAELEKQFDVTIITQNVDNLHERAGSSHVIHLHGSLFESRSTKNPALIYPIKGTELNIGDMCELGSQLRPNIVWFGEAVPRMEVAADIASGADVFIVAGTSMVVYPAAGLIDYVPDHVPKYVVDPKKPEILHVPNLEFIIDKASTGMEKLKRMLI
ncbi:MAG TPA: NAD-dependent deacylase [Cyclobacteriaceae bacterium]|jgi:NAD-dependent deacetylase|nr:NAD-dependent deacylase [Cytophagales bacterium]HMR56896.1 NAD-dependent deacylase [Cyclobacteriaceae bacterium]HRE66951.1 NAD-dependent deacylase [Cyclobacteriaceae bacterium]HRF33125.1 NAD-dependent deacylase [Cyclobacteriaceae bacterium]